VVSLETGVKSGRKVICLREEPTTLVLSIQIRYISTEEKIFTREY